MGVSPVDRHLGKRNRFPHEGAGPLAQTIRENVEQFDQRAKLDTGTDLTGRDTAWREGMCHGKKLGPRLRYDRVQRLVGREFLGQERSERGFLEKGGDIAHGEEGDGGDIEPELAAEFVWPGQKAQGLGFDDFHRWWAIWRPTPLRFSVTSRSPYFT